MSSINFIELLSRVKTWNAFDEEILLQKLKTFTEEYSNDISIIEKNISSLSKNVMLAETDLYDTVNTLKGVAEIKFIEHTLNTEEVLQKEDEESEEEQQQITNEEYQKIYTEKINNIIENSINTLPIKNENDKKNNYDDTSSISSSKLGSKAKKLKLPYILGTNEFYSSDFIGLYDYNKDIILDNSTKIRESTTNNNNEKEFIVEDVDDNKNNVYEYDKDDESILQPPPSSRTSRVTEPNNNSNQVNTEYSNVRISDVKSNINDNTTRKTLNSNIKEDTNIRISNANIRSSNQINNKQNLFKHSPDLNDNTLRKSNIKLAAEGLNTTNKVSLSNFISNDFEDEDDDFDSRLFKHSNITNNTNNNNNKQNEIFNQSNETETISETNKNSDDNTKKKRPIRKFFSLDPQKFNENKAKKLLNFLDEQEDIIIEEGINEKTKNITNKINEFTKEEDNKVITNDSTNNNNIKKVSMFADIKKDKPKVSMFASLKPKTKKNLFDDDEDDNNNKPENSNTDTIISNIKPNIKENNNDNNSNNKPAKSLFSEDIIEEQKAVNKVTEQKELKPKVVSMFPNTTTKKTKMFENISNKEDKPLKQDNIQEQENKENNIYIENNIITPTKEEAPEKQLSFKEMLEMRMSMGDTPFSGNKSNFYNRPSKNKLFNIENNKQLEQPNNTNSTNNTLQVNNNIVNDKDTNINILKEPAETVNTQSNTNTNNNTNTNSNTNNNIVKKKTPNIPKKKPKKTLFSLEENNDNPKEVNKKDINTVKSNITQSTTITNKEISINNKNNINIKKDISENNKIETKPEIKLNNIFEDDDKPKSKKSIKNIFDDDEEPELPKPSKKVFENTESSKSKKIDNKKSINKKLSFLFEDE